MKGFMLINNTTGLKEFIFILKTPTNIGIKVYEIWEDEIRSNDFSIIESILGVSLNKDSAVVRENIVKHIGKKR